MKIRDFRTHTINKSTPKPRNVYKAYKSNLQKDFCNRCAYCNIKDTQITTWFEVDHLIPRAEFKNIRSSLDTDYRNLIYSCKKCNMAKGNQFAGDVFSDPPENELFYNPATVDYNTIFYRNEFGAIDSDDEKGKDMIKRLKLYRPIHILAWLCEEINNTADKLDAVIENERDPYRKQNLLKVLAHINEKYRKYINLFLAAYNDNTFSISKDTREV